MRAALLLVALLLAAAGCVQPAADGPAVSAPGAGAALLAAPAVDAGAVLAGVKEFSEAFPMRRGDNDAHNAARASLQAAYESYGYEVVFDEFEAEISATSTPTSLLLGKPRLVNVCAMHWGATSPESWVVVGAHYDVTDGAVYGAYDDASGTMIVQKLAEAYATVATNRTIVFCAFDGEEQGLKGSGHMLEAIVNGEWAHTNGSVASMIDFDMAGIMYPSSPVLVADAVSPEFQAVITATREALEIPEAAIEFRGISGGSSDNGPFKAAEIPSVLFISNFDEVAYQGTTLPRASYPFWHRYDSYAGMVELAEGEEKLLAGFQNVVDIGSALLFAAANDMQATFKPFE